MRSGDIGLLLLALVALALASKGSPMPGGTRSDVQLATLVPGFREAVARVVARMRALGWDAVVREGVRSSARAQLLADKGLGTANSLHKIGLAADIISRSKGWDAPAGFWQALQSIAESEGLTSGATFSTPDVAHVQAVSVSEQSAARAWSPMDRERRMRARFG